MGAACMSLLGSLVCFPKDDPLSALKRMWNWFALRESDGCSPTPSFQQAAVCHRLRPCHSLTNSCVLGAKAVLLGTGKHSTAISVQQPRAAPRAKAGGHIGERHLLPALGLSWQMKPPHGSCVTEQHNLPFIPSSCCPLS